MPTWLCYICRPAVDNFSIENSKTQSENQESKDKYFCLNHLDFISIVESDGLHNRKLMNPKQRIVIAARSSPSSLFREDLL